MGEILRGIAMLVSGIGFACIPIAIYKGLKSRTDVKKLEQQRRILELEVEKQNNQLKIMEKENKELDRIIENTK